MSEIGALRNHPLEAQLADVVVKGAARHAEMIAVTNCAARIVNNHAASSSVAISASLN